MDTEVETLPSKSTRQEGYVEAKHCLCIELLPDVNERATRIFAPQVRVSDHMLDSVLCILPPAAPGVLLFPVHVLKISPVFFHFR